MLEDKKNCKENKQKKKKKIPINYALPKDPNCPAKDWCQDHYNETQWASLFTIFISSRKTALLKLTLATISQREQANHGMEFAEYGAKEGIYEGVGKELGIEYLPSICVEAVSYWWQQSMLFSSNMKAKVKMLSYKSIYIKKVTCWGIWPKFWWFIWLCYIIRNSWLEFIFYGLN